MKFVSRQLASLDCIRSYVLSRLQSLLGQVWRRGRNPALIWSSWTAELLCGRAIAEITHYVVSLICVVLIIVVEVTFVVVCGRRTVEEFSKLSACGRLHHFSVISVTAVREGVQERPLLDLSCVDSFVKGRCASVL